MSSRLCKLAGRPAVMAAATLLLFGAQAPVQATLVWQPAKAKHGKGHTPNRRAPKSYALKGGTGEVVLLKPGLERQPLELQNGKVKVRSTGVDNYHALVAESSLDDKIVQSAVRYLYMRGKPSGYSPSLVNKAVKLRLEIVPAPLPREHRRYNANHDAVFILRYLGNPVPATPITLRTANGTELTATTDRAGAVRFTFPDDLPETKPGRRANRPVEFVLSSELQREGQTFNTTLSAQYHADPAHWQSFELGVAVLGVGFVSGLAINRRGRRKSAQQDPRQAKTNKKGRVK